MRRGTQGAPPLKMQAIIAEKKRAVQSPKGWTSPLYAEILRNYLDNLAGGYSVSTFADGELEPLFHGDRVD